MRLAILSDTHVPARAERIPDWVRDELRAADSVVHAGDFETAEVLEEVRELSAELTAVRGNIDPDGLGLPAVATLEAGGVRFVVTHGTGPLETYRERVAATVADHAGDGPTVGVSGHTHQVMDEVVDGHRLLNPGSATGARPASRTTMMVADVADGDLEVELLEG
jgi:hypothetical protein